MQVTAELVILKCNPVVLDYASMILAMGGVGKNIKQLKAGERLGFPVLVVIDVPIFRALCLKAKKVVFVFSSSCGVF